MPETGTRLTDTLIAEVLQGRAHSTPPRSQWPDLLESANGHGVLPLLADAAASSRWDPEFVAAMRPTVAAEAVLAIVRERELKRVLTALGAERIAPLVMKGAHLAFTLYPSPDKRPRLDTDLLIREADRDRVKHCLQSIGYTPVPHVTGEVAFTQFQYCRVDERGTSHTLDVHWRIAIPKVFSDRLSYEDLARDAVPLPRLGSHAFAPSLKAALLVACVHRTAHHGTSRRLVWLYDIHLLAASLTPDDWQYIVEMASSRGLSSVVAAGLRDAVACFGSSTPSTVIDRLEALSGETERDVLEFLRGTPPQISVAISDWKRIRGMRERVRFIQEHLFPSAAYIRHRYGVSSAAALPVCYTHRIVTGAVKWVGERVSGGRE
jgi:hypothetical protein